ncbi:hypothetical protein [Deinococcus marmoris]|uniref:hypothetical protein n=1 Tax=Deinococcus marmoris TaxID=249408 RepID=UPI00068D5860|nr:hypothetical protein [Deinococcus marmoris]
MHDTKRCALSRTWHAHTTYRECGVVTSIATHTVTITRTPQGCVAEVDGQPVDVLAADRVLRAADRLIMIAETLEATGERAA